MIPVFRPSLGDEEFEAVREALRSGWIGTGPQTAEFEAAVRDSIGAPHVVAVSSGTAALFLALRVAGVEGGEVVTTPMTFVSTNHAILANGAAPTFADVEADTLNIDPADVARKLNPRTRAIVAVHYGGHPCDMDVLASLARERRIPLIEDAAHAFGATYRNRTAGTLGDYGCFSFQAVKNVTTGDGGAIALADSEVAARLLRLRWLGIDRDSWARARAGHAWEFDVTELSLKYQMNDLAAAIGLVQLRKLPAMNERRRAIAKRYEGWLAGVEGLELPPERADVRSAWHCYVIKLARAEWRNALVEHLHTRDIAATVHYVPSHLFSLYAPYRVPLPVVEGAWERIVTLPLFPDLRDEEVDQVADAVLGFLRRR